MKPMLTKAFRPIEKEVGTIDILVNNAGIIKRIPILDMPIADFKQVIDVDLVAPSDCFKTCGSGNDCQSAAVKSSTCVR